METARTQNTLTMQLAGGIQGPPASLRKENMTEKQEGETKTNQEQMEEPDRKVEAKVEHDFAIIATNIVITTPVVALNPENKELLTKEDTPHRTQEAPERPASTSPAPTTIPVSADASSDEAVLPSILMSEDESPLSTIASGEDGDDAGIGIAGTGTAGSGSDGTGACGHAHGSGAAGKGAGIDGGNGEGENGGCRGSEARGGANGGSSVGESERGANGGNAGKAAAGGGDEMGGSDWGGQFNVTAGGDVGGCRSDGYDGDECGIGEGGSEGDGADGGGCGGI